VFTITALALLASAPAPAPLDVAQFKKYGNARQVNKLRFDAQFFARFAREELYKPGKISRAEYKRYSVAASAYLYLYAALEARDAGKPREAAKWLARVREVLGPKDFEAGRIGPAVPKKWEKEFRPWDERRRPRVSPKPKAGKPKQGKPKDR
jgi:hypothetical protein